MSFSLHHFIHSHEVDAEKNKKIHENKYVRSIDKAVFVVAILGPLTTIPQVYKIFHNQNAEDISITTWILFTVAALFWLLYGVAHKNKPIIISNTLWTLLQSMVIAGAIIY